VPGDAVLLETVNLKIDESLLTGESMGVDKKVPVNSSDIKNEHMVFSGSMTIQGYGTAKVVKTGIHTEFGKIGALLTRIKQSETRLQMEMKMFVRKLFILAGIISVVIVFLFYMTRGNLINSLLNGLAASMAILPEEFPVVLTIFLALGAWRLSQKKVLTRIPSAIETLGSATVLCTDKTGTITQNKMKVKVLYTAKTIAFLQESTEVDLSYHPLIQIASLASRPNTADPMEIALHELNKSIEQDKFHELIREYPLSEQLLSMKRVVQTNSSSMIIATKGAPETILSLCNLSQEETDLYRKALENIAAKGYRVLGIATAEHYQKENLPEKQSDFKFTFMGFVGLEDPIRPEVPNAIKECRTAGIKVIMITGDFPVTARNIAHQIGLSSQADIMTGEELKNISEEDLKKRISNIQIFARVVPDQKLRIVDALKANGEIVAMTGDGVNDAPALKAAHIGIAMGNKGSDVAREASSMVLLDDNFASIVSAIRSGRRIFDNLQKSMAYILAIHIPIIGLTLLPAFIASLPLFLMPLHIVFMELIIDPICSVAFEAEQEEKGIMERPPRNPDKTFISIRMLLESILNGLLLLGLVIAVYLLSIQEGHSEGEVRAIAFSTLILGNIFLILTKLSKTRSFLSVFLEKNMIAVIMLTIAILLLFLILSIPMLNNLFSLEFPGYQHFIPALLGASALIVILESIKFIQYKKR
jgi:Ca2+-transporting ATPase